MKALSRRALMAAIALCPPARGAASPARADDVIRVVTDATFPPMEYVENGKLTGFDIELVEALAKAMGKKVEWTQIDFKGLDPGPGLQALRHGRVGHLHHRRTPQGASISAIPTTPAAWSLMVKTDNTTIKTPKDLDGKQVTVQVGTKSVGYHEGTLSAA